MTRPDVAVDPDPEAGSVGTREKILEAAERLAGGGDPAGDSARKGGRLH